MSIWIETLPGWGSALLGLLLYAIARRERDRVVAARDAERRAKPSYTPAE